MSHFFRFWLWLTTGIVTKEWVAVHRKHHATVESEDDPHSPQVHGINRLLWGGLFLYRRAARLPGILEKYGTGTPNDWLERQVYARFPNTGLVIMLVLDVALFGLIPGILIWIMQMVWIPFWAAGVINGVGHYWGYRNFGLSDESRNIVPWGILIGGEELHNNHHAYASSAQFSARPWEFDLGWWYVRMFSAMKLVKILRKIPTLSYERNNQQCDRETVKAFVTNRFQVLANYVHEVQNDVYHEEIRAASSEYRKIIKKAKRLLVVESSRLSEQNQERLRQFLASNQRIEQVYLMKESLSSIALKSSSSYESMRRSLEEWCKVAEESGIEPLIRFSSRLRSSETA